MTTMTPWGAAQSVTRVERGLLIVSTSGHGGIMVARGYAAKHLTVAAQNRGVKYGSYLCYEQDCASVMVLLELPQITRSPKATEETLIEELSLSLSDYLIERGIAPEPVAYAKYQQFKRDEQMRAEKHPDLITSAMSMDDEVVKVYTADNKAYFITQVSYAKRSGINLLSNCEIVPNYTQTTNMHY